MDRPWINEPDRVEWRHAGFVCLIVRSVSTGALCGYVGVPPGHPLYERPEEAGAVVSVHGGLTYGAHCQGPICHVPQEGESAEVFWLGFDCAHAGDLMPFFEQYRAGLPPDLRQLIASREVYRDMRYVTLEVNSLAEQLAAVSSGRARTKEPIQI